MSYLQQFLEQNLPQHLLYSLRTNNHDPHFYLHSSSYNIFSLTHALLSITMTSPALRNWTGRLVQKQLWIDYDCLRNFRICSNFYERVCQLCKGQYIQVHNNMYQLWLRLFRIFVESENCGKLSRATMKLIEEVSLIYPLLKTEVSISHPDIDLSQFLQHTLTINASLASSSFNILVCQQLQTACHFTGTLEKAVSQLISRNKRQLIIPVTTKMQSSSFNESEQDSDKQTKVYKNDSKHFNEAECFRKKRPQLIVKEIKQNPLKSTKSMTTIEATPVKVKLDSLRRTPRSDRRSETKKDERSETTRKSPLFKRIKKLKKPLERTLYHGETKRFIPKKSSAIGDDIFQLRHSLSAQPLMLSYTQTKKRTLKKELQQQGIEDMFMFGVPETPRPICKKYKVERRDSEGVRKQVRI